MNRTDSSCTEGKLLLDADGIAQKIQSLCQAVLKEYSKKDPGLAVVGIQTRGVLLARRMADFLRKESGFEIPVGTLDITLYRDDVHAIADQPEVKETDLPFDIEDRPILLVDDVFFTGRTVRSAMNALIDYGRPKFIRLVALVDRGHRELPIKPDYVGLAIETQPDDIVDVNLKELDKVDSIRIRKHEAPKKHATAL